MQKLNTAKFLTQSALSFRKWLDAIETAESYQAAKRPANAALGYLDCMTDFLNCMICQENNDFTEDLDELLDSWTRAVYTACLSKAAECGEDAETIRALYRKRDEVTTA